MIAAVPHSPHRMLVHPQFDPVAVKFGPFEVFNHTIGPIAIHWYGITYLVAFGLFLWLASIRVRQPQFAERGWTRREVEDLLFFGVLGVVVGGRLGYVLFYVFPSNFLDIFAVWKGGMSFHGGLLGVIAAVWFFAWKRGRPFLEITDLIAPCVPPGLASGRIGNFINGELWGRPADESLPWAMRFPQSGSDIARHPSQLYQFALEGMLLFVILWWFARKPRPTGLVSGVFLIGYGCFRFIAEYFREPDRDLGLQALGLSRGQWLCVPMVLAGIAVCLIVRYRFRGAKTA